MAIVVETLEQAGLVEHIRLDRRLWLTAEKDRVVEDGDPDAAFLYGIEDQLVPKPEAEKLGALPRKMVVAQKRAAAKAAASEKDTAER